MIGPKWDLFISTLFLYRVSSAQSDGRCEPITINFCRAVGYNQTKLPNRYDQTQSAIKDTLEKLDPLNSMKCHKDLRQFLCLFYMPYCGEKFLNKPLLPCRELCITVKDKCNKYVENWPSLRWPSELDCLGPSS